MARHSNLLLVGGLGLVLLLFIALSYGALSLGTSTQGAYLPPNSFIVGLFVLLYAGVAYSLLYRRKK